MSPMSNELKIGSELLNGAIITGINERGMWIVTRPDGSTLTRPRKPNNGAWANFKGNPSPHRDHPANPRFKLD